MSVVEVRDMQAAVSGSALPTTPVGSTCIASRPPARWHLMQAAASPTRPKLTHPRSQGIV